MLANIQATNDTFSRGVTEFPTLTDEFLKFILKQKEGKMEHEAFEDVSCDVWSLIWLT